ncbi:MAG: hypothetical protein ABSE48_22700, partial [Verrucomicrobiota bacterium]
MIHEGYVKKNSPRRTSAAQPSARPAAAPDFHRSRLLFLAGPGRPSPASPHQCAFAGFNLAGTTNAAYSSVAFDDNVNLSQTSPESDAIVGSGAYIGLAWQATGLTQLNFNSQVGYEAYLKNPQDDYLLIAPGSALTWSFLIDNWTLTFFDQFNYTRNVISVAAVSNISGIPIVNNTIGLRAQWQQGHWQLQAGY